MRPWRWLVSMVLLGAVLAQAGIGWRAAARPTAQTAPDPQTERLYPAGHLGGAATHIQLLEDDYAVLVQGVDLLILDVLDPYRPVQVGKLSFREQVTHLEVRGSTVYALVAGRVHVVEVADPRRPWVIGVLATSNVRTIEQDENYLYVGAEALEIYALSDPAAPELIGSYTTWAYANGGGPAEPYHPPVEDIVAAFPYVFGLYKGWYSYLEYRGRFWPFVLDVSTPQNPVELTGFTTYPVHRLVADQDYFYVLGDLSAEPDEQNVVWVTARAQAPDLEPLVVLPYHGRDLWLQDDRLYIAGGAEGLRILDVSDPLAPVELGQESTLADIRQVVVSGSLAFAAAGSQGLGVFNLRNPQEPVLAGGWRTAGASDWLLLDGERLYASSDRLEIIDVSDRFSPQVVGAYPVPGRGAVNGEVLFLAAGQEGLIALDVSDPAAPRALDRLDMEGGALDVALAGEYAYLASPVGLQVVDVRDPAALMGVGTVGAVDGRRIAAGPGFVALISETEVFIYDLDDPASPALAFQSSMPSSDAAGNDCGQEDPGMARGIATDGQRVFVAWDIYSRDRFYCTLASGGLLAFAPGDSGWEQAGEAYLVAAGKALNYWLMDLAVAAGSGYILAVEHYDPTALIESRAFKLWVFTVEGSLDFQIQETYLFPGWQTDFGLYDEAYLPESWDSDRRSGSLAAQGDLLVVGKEAAGVHLLYWHPEGLYFPLLQQR